MVASYGLLVWSGKPANAGGSFYAVLDCGGVYIPPDPKIEILSARPLAIH
jgi:hypothetical protein